MNPDRRLGVQVILKELFINDALKAGLGINHVEMLETIFARVTLILPLNVEQNTKQVKNQHGLVVT